MFQIHSGDYADMIDSYQKLKDVMEEEREGLQSLVITSKRLMDGKVIETFQIGYGNMLHNGVYDEMTEQLGDMITLMEEQKPLVNQLVEEGKLLAGQMDSDEALEPGTEEGATDSVVMLDDDYTSLINSGCDEILSLEKRLKAYMNRVFALCDGLVNLESEKSSLEEVSRYTRRVENLKMGFNRYVAGVHDLDENLCQGFKELVVGAEILSGLAMEPRLKRAAEYEEITDIEDILNKDPAEWTEEECERLSLEWNKAVAKGDIEMINLFNKAGSEKYLNEVTEEGSCNSKSLKDIDIDYNAIEEFERMYGYTEEEALLLYDAIEKLGESCRYERDSAAYINYVYGTLSTLCISYDARRWRMAALTPNIFQAKNRLYVAGLSSQQILDLQVLINLQHGDFTDERLKKYKVDITKSTFCNETHTDMMARCVDQNNDFAHQIIQIAEFACEDMMLEEDYIILGPWAIGLFNSSDFQHSYTRYEISFKGDIDSGRYSEADFQSDVDAINIYNRMRSDNESSLNKIWTEYYREVELGNTNRATEFFCNLGDGEEDIGILELDNILKKETFRSEYIQKGNDMSKEDIDSVKRIFVQWIFSEYYGFEYEFPK